MTVKNAADQKGMLPLCKHMSWIDTGHLAFNSVDKAQGGRDVAVVSTGDPGIYAIASTFFNYLKDKGLRVDVEVIPGVTVANAAAALLVRLWGTISPRLVLLT